MPCGASLQSYRRGGRRTESSPASPVVVLVFVLAASGLLGRRLARDGLLRHCLLGGGGLLRDGLLRDGLLRDGLLGRSLLGRSLLRNGLRRDGLLRWTLAREHRILERLQRGDAHSTRRLDADRFAGLRVAAHAGGALDAGELCETTDGDDLARRDGVGDEVDERLEAGVGGALIDLESLGEFGDEFSAVHCGSWDGGCEGACMMPPKRRRSWHRPPKMCVAGSIRAPLDQA